MVTTFACGPCRSVRVTSTLTVGRVAHIATRWLPELLCYLAAHCWFSPIGECSPFLLFLAVPTRCLLDDSRLLGVTLRPSALVCCCFRDSLTRGRLASAQEALRGPPSLSPRLVLHVMACARWFQAASEKCLFKR